MKINVISGKQSMVNAIYNMPLITVMTIGMNVLPPSQISETIVEKKKR